MKIHIEFANVVDLPKCNISVNDRLLYRGEVQTINEFDVDLADGHCCLSIEHWDKNPGDTVVEAGKIVRDRSFELKTIAIDDYDLEELIWQSEFRATDGAVYRSCLFFGPNGTWVLDFTNPILHWILETRHKLNDNDPAWEEDYHYYTEACRILKQISIK
jgi:hypothetical protein